MKKAWRVFVVVLVLLSFALSVSARENLTEAEKLGKGWIVSNMSYGADASILVLNVKALIEAPPSSVWVLLSDIGHWSSWMPIIDRARVIDRSALPAELEKVDEVYDQASGLSPKGVKVSDSGRTVVTTFEEFDLPFTKDWVIRRYTFDASGSGSGNYRVSWKQLFKGTDGRGGNWKISQYDGPDSDTLFEYHFRVKRKSSIPKKAFEILVGNTVDRFIRSIRRNVDVGLIDNKYMKRAITAKRGWWER